MVILSCTNYVRMYVLKCARADLVVVYASMRCACVSLLLQLFANIHTLTNVCTYARACIHTHIHNTYIHIHTHTTSRTAEPMCSCHGHIHAYIYTYIHARIHIHIHTHNTSRTVQPTCTRYGDATLSQTSCASLFKLRPSPR